MIIISRLLLLSEGVPYDRAAIEKLHPLNQALIITYFIMASAGLVFAVVCLLFNIVFRNRRVYYNIFTNPAPNKKVTT